MVFTTDADLNIKGVGVPPALSVPLLPAPPLPACCCLCHVLPSCTLRCGAPSPVVAAAVAAASCCWRSLSILALQLTPVLFTPHCSPRGHRRHRDRPACRRPARAVPFAARAGAPQGHQGAGEESSVRNLRAVSIRPTAPVRAADTGLAGPLCVLQERNYAVRQMAEQAIAFLLRIGQFFQHAATAGAPARWPRHLTVWLLCR